MLLEILCASLLGVPTFWAVFNDRNGDVHPNNDWIWIGIMMIGYSVLVCTINDNRSLEQALFLSYSIYLALFPWIINYVHYKRKVAENPKWWLRLSDTAIPDKWPIWTKIGWIGRAIVLFLILTSAIIVYAI